MKRHFTILLCLMTAAALPAEAQPQGRAQIAQKRIDYVKNNLSLNEKESRAFWPLYTRQVNAEIAKHKDYAQSLTDKGIPLHIPGKPQPDYKGLNDEQLTFLQERRFRFRQELLTLETDYYRQYKAILSPRHIVDLYNADAKYKRTVVHNARAGSK